MSGNNGAAQPVAGLSRLRSVLGEGEQVFLDGAAMVQAVIDDVTDIGMQPTPQARIRLQGAVEGLQRKLRRCAGLLREGAEQLLEPNETALAAAVGAVAERRALIASCLPSCDGSSADDPGEVPKPEEAELDAREEAMLERIAADPHLTPPLRDLFRMEFMAATKLLSEAAELEAHAGDLGRREIAEHVEANRIETAPAVARFAEHLERWRALLEEDQEKIAAVDEAAPVFARLVGLLTDLGADWDALVASEQGRARAFADLLRERAEPADRGRTAASAAHLDRATLESVLREHDRSVVEYFLRDDELVIWLIPRGAREIVVRRQKISRHEVVEQVDELRRLLDEGDPSASSASTTSGPGVEERLQALGDLLWNCLPPQALPSNPDEAVYVVPHDVLFRVPFSALRDAGGRYLVDRHALVLLPSVAMLPLLRGRRQRAQTLRSSAVTRDDRNGDRAVPRCLAMVSPTPMPRPDPAEFPEISGPLGELEMTAECFAGIADLFGDRKIVVHRGAEATWDAFRAHAPDADLLIFATHAHAVTGVGDAERDPFDSFIALAPTSTHDGLLRARDLGADDLALRADLAILGACSTGSGRITGDGVLGLGRAFLAAGSTTLLMTLEETPEEIALEVVHRFLERWLDAGEGAASLRQALTEIRGNRRYADPALWSLFVLFGLDLTR